jgi:hypothetical protein
VFDELDDVAAYTTAATVEDLLLGIDSETIVATAFRTGADTL